MKAGSIEKFNFRCGEFVTILTEIKTTENNREKI